MTARLHTLINALSDGRFHSGEGLGAELGISRAAVWKLLQKLEPLGLQLHAVSGKGYRLATPFEPLERDAVIAALEEDSLPLLSELEILPEVESTNRYLLESAGDGAPGGSACFAEYQQAGRGRRGREWHSPYGSSIYFSLLWRFNDGTSRLAGLSLAVAVALMRCLEECGLERAGIKWPNDILVEGRKLAGILLDVAGEHSGPCHVVIGIGINGRVSQQQGAAIDQPWTDLWQSGVEVGRNRLAGRLLHHLLLAVEEYQEAGLDAFLDEWRGHDLTCDREVAIHHGSEVIHGIARGVDRSGMLQVEQSDGLRSYASGEVSLRSAG